MGWTETYRRKGEKLADFFFKNGWSSTEKEYRVLDSALVNCSEFYAAIEVTEKATGNRYVWAAVFLVKMFRKTRDGYNICYKDMDETCGPYQHNCPERILDLLTPTESEYANQWRARCREVIAQRKRKPALTAGTVLLANPPISFSDGSTQDALTVRGRKGSRISFVGGYQLSLQWINRALANQKISFAAAT